MLLSIVIPSYNQGSYIRETLDSIFAQDYRPIEVLVLDGASKDDTVEILRSYGAPELRWWSEPDRGVVDAVNKGLARASGDVVAIQSSDDFYLPGAFRAAIDALASRGAGLVYGDVEYVDAQSRVSGRTALPPFDLYEYAGKLTYIPQASTFFTAEAMRAAGRWREDVSYAADAEYYLRIALRFPVRKIDRVLARYRYHEEQRDKMRDRVQRDWAAAVAPLLASPDRRLRRYAKSGLDLVKLRYLPEERWMTRTRAAWHAMLVNPAVLRSAEFRATRDLVPARYPI
jgi:glycosyltransferase involved in cell wall biosynthesis